MIFDIVFLRDKRKIVLFYIDFQCERDRSAYNTIFYHMCQIIGLEYILMFF